MPEKQLATFGRVCLPPTLGGESVTSQTRLEGLSQCLLHPAHSAPRRSGFPLPAGRPHLFHLAPITPTSTEGYTNQPLHSLH